MNKKRIAVTGLCAACVLMLSACGKSAAPSTAGDASAVSSSVKIESSASVTASGSPSVTSSTSSSSHAESASGSDHFVYAGEAFSISNDDIPDGYVLVPYAQFEEGFKKICNLKAGDTLTYADVANLFGGDGIQMTGIVYDGYAYYSWYSDQDYTGDTKTHVLVTFKDDNGNLTYYAYSSEGITPQDVLEK